MIIKTINFFKKLKMIFKYLFFKKIDCFDDQEKGIIKNKQLNNFSTLTTSQYEYLHNDHVKNNSI